MNAEHSLRERVKKPRYAMHDARAMSQLVVNLYLRRLVITQLFF